MKKAQPDYYAVLGVPRDASAGAIKQAYRELVRRYHPDAAGDSPQARSQFERLQEAYEVLSDSDKRAKYDATLPPRKYPLPELDAQSLWREATALVFERSDSFSSLIQTMRLAVPIALEGSLLVIGVAGKDQYLAGHLDIPGNRYRIREALREISGEDIDYRVIEGTTEEDWEFVQRAEGRRGAHEPAFAPPTAAPRAARAKEEARAPQAPEVSAWELLGRKIHNAWGGTANRQHPITRAEFLMTCVQWIAETSKQATQEGAPADAIRREVGKAVERVAQMVDLPPAAVALELVRGQHRRRGS
jgi:curved DNA-binding protein CbpA